jgi:hypothetical protein
MTHYNKILLEAPNFSRILDAKKDKYYAKVHTRADYYTAETVRSFCQLWCAQNSLTHPS